MTDADQEFSPGWPGIPATWTSSAKSGVGTAIGSSGRVWFTVSHGILNEVYYPRVDQACIRDLGLVITDGHDFLSEEKRDAYHEITTLADGVPAFRMTNICTQGKYQIVKDVIADPTREVILQRIRFTALEGELKDFRLFVLLAPHLANSGGGNTAWLGDFKGTRLLFAHREGSSLALASSTPWSNRSAGFVGTSDGWQDLTQHHQMTQHFDRAENGNVALTGEVDLAACGGEFTLALGFGRAANEAAHRAMSSLWDGFDAAASVYIADWQAWQKQLRPIEIATDAAGQLLRISTTVLRTHQSAHFPGGIIASLSVPWGFARGDGDLGGYHLVWPRDLFESATGLLAIGAIADAQEVLRYLAVTQETDGHWPQNMWLDGTPYWNRVQMDETGFPILLADLALRHGALTNKGRELLWPMIRKAAAYLVCNGPVTQQDRWEEEGGYSPFTLAVEISALLAAADFADRFEPSIAGYLRETADVWNASIERWTYVSDTELSRRIGVDGYYVRITAPELPDAASPHQGFVPIKNRPPGESHEAPAEMISPDALALVRFGLRAPDDPRIVNTVKVIDTLLRVETPSGPLWRRYNGDKYGEHADGSPFDGDGIGRLWPLLTAERAHFELAAGKIAEATALRDAMPSFAGQGGLLPEQVWDAADLPERELFFGKPSGSAMPLAWAHAEYIKLCRSLADGEVYDMPPQTVQRYQKDRIGSPYGIWRFNDKCRMIPQGKVLRVEVLQPAIIHWSTDGWKSVSDTPTQDTLLGLHIADLPTAALGPGVTVTFTFYWPGADSWERSDFMVGVTALEPAPEGKQR